MDIVFVENGYFIFKIVGDVVSLFWRWIFILYVLGLFWINLLGEVLRIFDLWS